jgi:aryl-alcohol dehydrogenase (NADP+)
MEVTIKKFFRRKHTVPQLGQMKYLNLGRSGPQVSNICLGTMSFGSTKWQAWTISEDKSRLIVQRALELGVNFFDTADVYSTGLSEEILGRALVDFAKRDQIVLATKVNGPMGAGPNDRGLSRKHIMQAIDASLRRLRTDYVDLYQIHRWDYGTPIEETLYALNDLVRSGKVLYLGASSMFAWEFSRALHICERNGWSRFVSMQNHYNLVYREEEREMIPLCHYEGIAVLPWSPLARGLLAGTRKRNEDGSTLRARTDEYARRLYVDDHDFEVADRAAEIARSRGVKPAQIAMAWLLGKAGVTAPVVGATSVEHIEEAVASLGIALDPSEVQQLEGPYRPHPVLGHEGPPR